MSIFVRRYLNRSRSVEHLVEDWKLKHSHAIDVPDVEELVSECVDLGVLAKHAWQFLRQLLSSDPNGECIEEFGKVMKKAISKTLEVFATVQELVADVKTKGFTIDSAAIETTFQDVRQISAKLETIFPTYDKSLFEESRAAFERGDYIPIEDLIREAQGGGAPAH